MSPEEGGCLSGGRAGRRRARGPVWGAAVGGLGLGCLPWVSEDMHIRDKDGASRTKQSGSQPRASLVRAGLEEADLARRPEVRGAGCPCGPSRSCALAAAHGASGSSCSSAQGRGGASRGCQGPAPGRAALLCPESVGSKQAHPCLPARCWLLSVLVGAAFPASPCGPRARRGSSEVTVH